MKRAILSRQLICSLVVTTILISVAHLGCDAKKPVRIGFIGGTTGRVADLGISGLDAVQLAVEQGNQQGGIGGRQVRLLIKDDQQNPDTARQAAQDLIREGAIAIVGPMTSDMAMAITPLLNEARVLTVSPTVTTQRLSGHDDYFFRVSSTTLEYATLSAHYQIKSGDMRHIAAAYDKGNRSFCENWLENFKAPFIEGGGEILATIAFKTDENISFSEIAHELLGFES